MKKLDTYIYFYVILTSILLISASIITPVYNFFNVKPTRTDTFTEGVIAKIDSLNHIEKSEAPELNDTAAGLATNTVSYAPATYAAAPATNITIAGRVIPLYYSDTNPDGNTPPYGLAYKYTDANFIYGHNSYDVFGGLEGIAIGTEFTINLGDSTGTYRITNKGYVSGALMPSSPYYPKGGRLTIMTCAAGVTDGSTNPNRFVMIAERI